MKVDSVTEVDYNDIIADSNKPVHRQEYCIPVKHYGGLKKMIKKFGGTVYIHKDGRLLWVDKAHTMMIENIAFNPELLEIVDGHQKIPDLKLSCEVEDILGVENDIMALVSGDTVSCYSMEHMLSVIDTFGKPDKILMDEDSPLVMYYPNDMWVMLAPKAVYGGAGVDVIKFDFQAWFPAFYGMKKRRVSADSVINMLGDMNPDMALKDALTALRTIMWK